MFVYCFCPYQLEAVKIASLENHTDLIRSISFSINDLIAAGSKNKSVIVYKLNLKAEDTTFNEVLKITSHTNCVTSVCFSPNGVFLATGSYDFNVHVYSMNEDYENSFGKIIFTFSDHTGWVGGVCFSNDDDFLISGGWDGIAIIYGMNPLNNDKYGEKICKVEVSSSPILSVSYSNLGLLSLGLLDEICHLYC